MKIKKFAKAALLPVLMFGAVVSVDAAPRNSESTDYFRFAQKAKGLPGFGNGVEIPTNSPKKVAALDPKLTIVGETPYGFLDGPDGSVWYYTTDMTTEEKPVDGYYEGYTETVITGYSFVVYNSNLEKIGEVKDDIVLAEDETRVAQVMLDACVTKKFFNSDDNYELIVSIACNKPDYSIGMHTYAYSIGGSKDANGYDIPVAEIDGYVVSAMNAATDEWSEDFYITFMTQSSDLSLDDYIEYLESCKYNMTVYKKAGWGSSITEIAQISIPQTHLPGDQMAVPFLMTYAHDGSVWIVAQQYEKRYYQDPAGMSDNEAPMEDNNLVITLYEAMGSKLYERQVTKVPVVQETRDQDLYTYFSVGNFGYTEDIDYGNFVEDASRASFVVTKQVYSTASDSEYRTSYHLYSADGEEIRTIAEEVQGFTRLTDLDGYEPQYMLLQLNGAGDDYVFNFMDLYSGEIVAQLPRMFEGFSMRGQLDRYVGGDSYMWGISVNDVIVDEDANAYEQVIWVNAAGGFIDHVDKINLGKDVAYATPYIANDAMSPYLFNTDSEREYMYLVKRYITKDGSETAEELIISSTSGKNLMTLGSDEVKGALSTVSLLNVQADAQLCVIYNDESYNITQDIYELPFTKFEAGGEGTAENPYIISSVGDLQMIAEHPSSHYVLGNDIDGSGYEFRPLADIDFTGTLNGAGKTISNLTIGTSSYTAAIFGMLSEGSVIKDINFSNVKIKASERAQYVGVISGEAISTAISNVHVDGLYVDGLCEAYAGGLVGYLSLYSEVASSSVSNAEINLPNAITGGIAGVTRTSSKLLACAFHGSINGGGNVGGIVGEAGAAGDAITDCHVSATLVGVNNVGGVAGTSSRAQINRCYVEGSLEAIGPDMWSGACVGGVAGVLAGNYGEPEKVPVIAGCLVNVSSIKGFETKDKPEFPTQYTTIHRIVGKTAINEDSSLPAERAIADNYAIATLPLGEEAQEAVATGVEGASVEADAITVEFLTGLGYVFGSETAAPWREDTTNKDFALYYETDAVSGVEDEVVAESAISYVGGVVKAEGCQIAVYSVSGVMVAGGVDAVDTENLAKGIYVAVATAADGSRSSLKIAK